LHVFALHVFAGGIGTTMTAMSSVMAASTVTANVTATASATATATATATASATASASSENRLVVYGKRRKVERHR
jgi:hypothetical protein